MRQFNVKVNGQQYFVEIDEADSTAAAIVREDKDKTQPAQKIAEGSSAVIAPMPGLILSLVVENGSVVKKMDKILVIEAMKMEHDIVAGADGKIAFLVKKGDSVVTGDQLAFIK